MSEKIAHKIHRAMRKETPKIVSAINLVIMSSSFWRRLEYAWRIITRKPIENNGSIRVRRKRGIVNINYL